MLHTIGALQNIVTTPPQAEAAPHWTVATPLQMKAALLQVVMTPPQIGVQRGPPV